MGVDIFAYVPKLSKDMLPLILQRLAEYGLACEIHPETVIFDETEANHWYLCFKMKFCKYGPKEIVGKEILTGFEFYALNFDYDIALSDLNDGLRAANPPNALQKLTGKKYEPKTFFADGQSIDARLRECERSVEINLYKETEELIGIAFASIVADLGDGVFHNGDTEEYLFGKDAVARIPELIRNLPSGLDWDLFEFWPE